MGHVGHVDGVKVHKNTCLKFGTSVNTKQMYRMQPLSLIVIIIILKVLRYKISRNYTSQPQFLEIQILIISSRITKAIWTIREIRFVRSTIGKIVICVAMSSTDCHTNRHLLKVSISFILAVERVGTISHLH